MSLFGESGWSRFGQRGVPRVIRGRGPYNAPFLTCRFCLSRMGELKIIVFETEVTFLRSLGHVASGGKERGEHL